MIRFTHQLCHFRPHTCTLLRFLGDALRFLCLCLRPSPMLAAGNLFLCKQLSLYQERHLKPRLATDAARFTLVWLARGFDWRQALLWPTRNVSPPASPGIPVVLAMEIPGGTPIDSCGPASAHPLHRPRQPVIG
jgi:hypothetical protein